MLSKQLFVSCRTIVLGALIQSLLFPKLTRSKGYCSFPLFLWDSPPDGSDRKWLGRTEYSGSADSWITQWVITALETELKIQQRVQSGCVRDVNASAEGGLRVGGRKGAQEAGAEREADVGGGVGRGGGKGTGRRVACHLEETVYSYICLSEEPDGKYRVQQISESGSRFSCLKFDAHNLDVLTVYKAKPSIVNEDRLCHDPYLKEDKWPWRSPEKREWNESCNVLRGGFDFYSFLETNKEAERLCPSSWRPARLESDCARGEGLVFLFPATDCSFFHRRQLEERFQCWASWEHGYFLYILFGEPKSDARYVLRLQLTSVNAADKMGRQQSGGRRTDKFVAHLFLSPIATTSAVATDFAADSDEESAVTKSLTATNVIELRARRSETGICYDESEYCAEYALQGRCTNAAMFEYANYCKRSCRICDPSATARPECKFPAELIGDWTTFSSRDHELITVGRDGDVTMSSRGSFVCKSRHWEKDLYKLFSVFKDGCRPRYTCMSLTRRSASEETLSFTLFDSHWSERSFDTCDTGSRPEQTQPRAGQGLRGSVGGESEGGTTVNQSWISQVLFPISSTTRVRCNVGPRWNALFLFADGRQCHCGVDNVNVTSCISAPNTLTVTAASSACTQFQYLELSCVAQTNVSNEVRLLVTKTNYNEDQQQLQQQQQLSIVEKYICWIMTMSRDRVSVLSLRRARCETMEEMPPSVGGGHLPFLIRRSVNDTFSSAHSSDSPYTRCTNTTSAAHQSFKPQPGGKPAAASNTRSTETNHSSQTSRSTGGDPLVKVSQVFVSSSGGVPPGGAARVNRPRSQDTGRVRAVVGAVPGASESGWIRAPGDTGGGGDVDWSETNLNDDDSLYDDAASNEYDAAAHDVIASESSPSYRRLPIDTRTEEGARGRGRTEEEARGRGRTRGQKEVGVDTVSLQSRDRLKTLSDRTAYGVDNGGVRRVIAPHPCHVTVLFSVFLCYFYFTLLDTRISLNFSLHLTLRPVLA